MRVLSVLFISWIVSQSSFAHDQLPSYAWNKMLMVAFEREGQPMTLMGLNLMFGESQWIEFSPLQARTIVNQPNSMSTIAQAKVSANQQWLAVVSVGEGHPILDITTLSDVLASKKTTVEPVQSVNPYPGYLSFVRWQGNVAVIETDRLLTHEQDGQYPYALADGSLYGVHVVTGEITGLSDASRAPIQYYRQSLLSSDKWTVINHLEALMALKAKQALPEVKQLLKVSSDKEVRLKAQTALTVLSQ